MTGTSLTFTTHTLVSSPDVIILGGGISGALIAWELVSAGVRTLLIEGDTIAGGSTSLSTCMLMYEPDKNFRELQEEYGYEKTKEIFQLTYHSLNHIAHIAENIIGAEECSFNRRKSVCIASTPEDVPPLREELDLHHKLGFDVFGMEQSEIEELFPFSAPFAMATNHAAQMNCKVFTRRLIDESVARGLQVMEHTRVASTIEHADHVEITTEAGQTLKASHLIIAAGYKTQDYVAKKIAENNITYVYISEPLQDIPEEWWNRCLLWETARPYYYMRTTADNRVVIGGLDEKGDPASLTKAKRIYNKTEALKDKFEKMFPSIKLSPAFRYNAIFAETPDSLPRIGSLPDHPRTHYAMGYGGNGIVFSTIAARIIKDDILGVPNPSKNLFTLL